MFGCFFVVILQKLPNRSHSKNTESGSNLCFSWKNTLGNWSHQTGDMMSFMWWLKNLFTHPESRRAQFNSLCLNTYKSTLCHLPEQRNYQAGRFAKAVFSLLLTHTLHKHIFIVRQAGFQPISRASALNMSIIHSLIPFSKQFHLAEVYSAKALDLIQESPLRLAVKALITLLDGIGLKLPGEQLKNYWVKTGLSPLFLFSTGIETRDFQRFLSIQRVKN